MEPALNCTAALFSPATGIIDTHALMLALLGEAEEHGAVIAFRSSVIGGRPVEGGMELEVGGAEPSRLRARTVLQALNLLGLDVASKALAGIALRHEFSGSPSLERFWDASAKIAEYSGMLVGLLGKQHGVQADDAYTFGLFRDCGVPVLMRKFPQYREILGLANAEPVRRFTEIEEEHLPTNHALVGCMLAQSWSLPEEICQAIRHHHDFILLSHPGGNLPAASARLVALSQLAEHFHQRKSGRSQGHEWAKLAPACLAILQLQPEQLEELQQALSHSLQQNA